MDTLGGGGGGLPFRGVRLGGGGGGGGVVRWGMGYMRGVRLGGGWYIEASGMNTLGGWGYVRGNVVGWGYVGGGVYVCAGGWG